MARLAFAIIFGLNEYSAIVNKALFSFQNFLAMRYIDKAKKQERMIIGYLASDTILSGSALLS